uniref:Uncharacterized protein n=1 Tax=Chromera velia CCMP2878 TaxID=1169474 RepID=A0A0G4IBB7_9ALVE|eukprot:Cvel_12701.t1-p1 / transcript=Cvel_12701.t1 / gene=Cvel_12701 / organism=Chromera_velia_CCMP2878 / gene_product=hypothetical protein / transcript_product=hypothetical protein / location=Cvel_scaffold842:682-1122(-) / protein_length=147 / sequence_SO=supercontig / SO=protein_coding / is_pseudo=false
MVEAAIRTTPPDDQRADRQARPSITPIVCRLNVSPAGADLTSNAGLTDDEALQKGIENSLSETPGPAPPACSDSPSSPSPTSSSSSSSLSSSSSSSSSSSYSPPFSSQAPLAQIQEQTDTQAGTDRQTESQTWTVVKAKRQTRAAAV